ncbi:unnamed protein product [Miscanthus lutarioriparius]|uniref:Uncharacterized protein n=1 Tax=Miscanthus lutarioriparius TaxID=422564 RepID=A0A811REB5_9POAL|nr:unnamed protein product [Miscanthus lutarioriparius]
MASSSSSFLLMAVALAKTCLPSGRGVQRAHPHNRWDSSSTKLSLITNIAISEVSVKPKAPQTFGRPQGVAKKHLYLRREGSRSRTYLLRLAAKAGGYRVVDDVILADFKAVQFTRP